MIPKRIGRDESFATSGITAESALLSIGALRDCHHQVPARNVQSSDEHKISVFWRVFGGAIISIAALAAITLYNNLGNGISELRTELNRQTEVRAELVKKDEFNNRSTTMWNRIEELRTLKEKVTGIESQLKVADEDHRSVMQLQSLVSALQEKAATRDALLKQADDERRSQAKELQELRERLAKLEGAQQSKSAPRTP